MDELHLFLYTANKVGLDPLVKQIHFVKYKLKDGDTKMTIITGIDGYRAIAERTHQLAGMDDVVYDGGAVYAPGKEPKQPSKATITVYRAVGGQKVAFTATARWTEYYPKNPRNRGIWDSMPYNQLGKCAEALALRKAFPTDLSGLYVKEEMDQAEIVLEPIEPGPAKMDVKVGPTPTPAATKPADGEIVTEPIYYCHGCDIEITKAVHDYSMKLYKKPLCRECQKAERG